MCGICGEYNYATGKPASGDTVKKMTQRMIHRGPDDEGYHFSGPVGLGFRRLSIIDLEGGHQPMSDASGRVWVVFNGEIYNFKELRASLQSLGHEFRTQSDTEVIVAGYRQWGVDALNHLNGIFGLAIWDEDRKRLVIARDRMGIKLVYFRLTPNALHFASEIRPLLAICDERPKIAPTALYLFLRYRYTPSPLTVFDGIRKLAPGTCLIAERGTCIVKRWWNSAPRSDEHIGSVDDVRDTLLDIYRRVVKRQLISDVPVGLLLSGGIDSGLLLGLMEPHGDSCSTFTVGYGSSFRDDELRDAAETAQIFGAQHAAIEIDRHQFEESLPRIILSLEEPIASSSIVPMFHVCQLASTSVKVALMGQGPDELFGGYRRHLGVRYGELWRQLPSAVRTVVKSGLKLMAGNETVSRALYSLDEPRRMVRYQQVFSILPGEEVDALFQDGLIDRATGDSILECWSDLAPSMKDTDELGGLQFLEIRSSLPDELLMYADKLSMAHSLELRVPYLDQEIVDYVERLPSNLKIRAGARKWIHKQACRQYLPEQIIRRKKRGFAVNVVDEWFQDLLQGKMNRLLEDPSSFMYEYLRHGEVMRLLNDHRSGRRDNHKILFSLVVFEEWLRIFVVGCQ